jgi:hypothetical protein
MPETEKQTDRFILAIGFLSAWRCRAGLEPSGFSSITPVREQDEPNKGAHFCFLAVE